MKEQNKNAKSRRDTDGSGPSQGAVRLLAALCRAGATGRLAPDGERVLLVSTGVGRVSLPGASFPVALAEDLVRADLAAWSDGGGSGRSVLLATSAGRSRDRRGAASPADAFRAQHGAWEVAPSADGAGTNTVNTGESPLDWLRRRKDRDGEALIDPACYEAGERLRRDLTTGGILPSVTARWDGTAGTGGGPRDPAAAADATIAARQRVSAALAAIGSDFAGLLVDLCGFLKGLEVIERERRWPARSGKVVVRLALKRLAEHYGLDREARGRDRSGGIRNWTAEPDQAAATRRASA